jgi:hypothetical protein
MVMRKIVLGSIVLFSLVFLAACGGGGGSGSTGAAGAAGAAGGDGDAGAAGSIAVPSADTNTFVSATDGTDALVGLDSCIDDVSQAELIGTICNTYTITGIDNTSAIDSRLRYYLYEGSSATAKTDILEGSTVTCTTGGTDTNCTTTNVIDPRNMTIDNITLTLDAHPLTTSDGLTTHLIICPGNEAGDAASCNSVALVDRGTVASDGVSILGGSTGSATGAVHGLVGSTGSATYLVESLVDNNSWYSQEISLGTRAAKPTLSGSASSQITVAAGATRADPNSFFLSGDVISTSSAVYVMAPVPSDPDNWSVTTIGGSTIYLDNLTMPDESLVDNARTVHYSLDSNGALYFTMLGSDNVTFMAYKGGVSTGAYAFNTGNFTRETGNTLAAKINTLKTSANNGVCSVVHPTGGALFASVTHDNDSQQFISTSGGAWALTGTDGRVAGAVRTGTMGFGGVDNETGHLCRMAFDGGSPAIGWYAAAHDNNTGLVFGSTTDNFTTMDNVSGWRADGSGALNDLAMVIEPGTNMPIVVASFDTTAQMWMYDNKTSLWAQLGPDVTVDTGERVGLAIVDTDNYVMTTTDGDNTTITVFHDQ